MEIRPPKKLAPGIVFVFQVERNHAGPARRRDALTIAAALLGHAALLAISYVIPKAPPPPEPPLDALFEETTVIELFAWAPAPREDPSPSTEAPIEPLGSRRAVIPRTSEPLPDLPAPQEPKTPDEAAPLDADPKPSKGDEYGIAPTVPMAGGGPVIGAPVWAVPGALPKGDGSGQSGSAGSKAPLTPRIPNAPGKNVLRDTVEAHNHSLGIGTSGATAVANAVNEAVWASSIPPESTAVMVAQVNGDGVIVSLQAQRFFGGNIQKWNSIAQAALAALGKKKLPIAGIGKGGATVRIYVRSDVTLPSGSKEAFRARLPSLTEGPPRDVMPAPTPDGDACAPERRPDLGTLCGVGANVGSFDLADVGRTPHRTVKTTFQVQHNDAEKPIAELPPAAPPPPAPKPTATHSPAPPAAPPPTTAPPPPGPASSRPR